MVHTSFFIASKLRLFLIILFTCQTLLAQKGTKIDTIFVDSIPKKILYDGKVYKLNAGFFTMGTGLFLSNSISEMMKGVSVSFNFHTFRECFIQVGFIKIKDNKSLLYPEKKDITVSYFNFLFSPLVFKTENIHFAFIFNPIGITYGGGYKDEKYYYQSSIAQDSINMVQNNYFGFNLYSSASCIYKFKFDIGIGAELYAEYMNNSNIITGIKLGIYLSAAFRGNQNKPAWYYKKNPDKE